MDAHPDEPVPEVPAKGARPKRGYLGPGIIALVALVGLALILNYTGQRHPTPHTISAGDAATLVSQGLQAENASARPPQVTCPATEPVRTGLVFECTWHRSHGAVSTVVVTESNSRGTLTFRVVSNG